MTNAKAVLQVNIQIRQGSLLMSNVKAAVRRVNSPTARDLPPIMNVQSAVKAKLMRGLATPSVVGALPADLSKALLRSSVWCVLPENTNQRRI